MPACNEVTTPILWSKSPSLAIPKYPRTILVVLQLFILYDKKKKYAGKYGKMSEIPRNEWLKLMHLEFFEMSQIPGNITSAC